MIVRRRDEGGVARDIVRPTARPVADVGVAHARTAAREVLVVVVPRNRFRDLHVRTRYVDTAHTTVAEGVLPAVVRYGDVRNRSGRTGFDDDSPADIGSDIMVGEAVVHDDVAS